MDGIQGDDPFTWDVARVSKELCAPGSPWTRDPSALANTLSEEEIDGYTLLTYEFIYSRKELMECLGVKIARHRAALGEAVIGFQARSRAFRSWKKDFVRKQSMDLSDNEPDITEHRVSSTKPATSVENAPPKVIVDTLTPPNQPESRESADQGDTPMQEDNANVLSEENSAPVIELQDGEQGHAPESEIPPQIDPAGPSHDQARFVPSSTPVTDDRASKRRRVAPTNLSTQPPSSMDPPTNGTGTRGPYLAEEASNLHAYLGRGCLNITALKSHTGSLNSRLMTVNESSFATSMLNNLPPGQRRVVGRTMKKLFIRNARKEALVKQGIVPMRSPTPSDEDDQVLDLDDLPDFWDEETLKEIAEEQDEIAARERELARCLTQDRVETVLKEAIEEMKSKWEEVKLPRYQRKAYKLWTDARRRERTKREIIDAHRQAEFYESRIKKLCAEILKDTWQKEQEVRNQAKVMEQNLEDKLYRLWLIELLESRVQPPKPNVIPRPKTAAKAPSASLDDEILTSSDEEDFIVPDDEDENVVDEELDDPYSPKLDRHENGGVDQGLDDHYSPAPDLHESPAPSERDSLMYVDLTQLDSPTKYPNSEATRVFIDLTTPIKPKLEPGTPSACKETGNDLLAPPPIDQLERVEAIGEHPGSHWSKQKDRWRLVICLIWKLTQIRRQWLLRVVQEKSADEAWQSTIQLQLSHPITEESQIGKEEARTAAFDLTRIFLSFLKCRQCKDARIMALERKDRLKLGAKQHQVFQSFCTFVNEMAPNFPQDSQIFRTDALDDEIDMDDMDDEVLAGTPSKTRKHGAREIVRNKEGVDLRERDQRRAEDQEARRLKLRAALANNNFMARDKSRLIINESKQEHQSFIYVHEEIGKRVKDHQVEGVRFLWNQIVLDADVRQGCLLAHTMGLGKTMQIITFLVAIMEAATSDDASVREQIPVDLRQSQTLVLCPSGLVDNWMDEILLWAPQQLLGNLRKVEAAMPVNERDSTIRNWERDGGVLVMGYDMLKRTCKDGLEQILVDTPRMVIADEAHYLKDTTRMAHQVCAKFRTRSRIALTGSPLSNNVEEYFAMIDWVAPNYLGPLQEFRDIYANTIQQGLWSDSSAYEKRKALKTLEVLKLTVAPKVQRATIQCIRNDFPPKYEFVISVAPTSIQQRLYAFYLQGISQDGVSQARMFNVLDQLTLVCNHPRCFRQKMLDARQKCQENKESAFPESMISTVLKETNGIDLDDPSLSLKVVLLNMILDEARQLQDKVLVFSQSIPTLDYLENLFRMQKRLVCRLDGKTAISKRQDMIKSFNSGKQEVYLISTRAGGVGLNIQGANRVVIFDFKWNPVTEQQAVGRAYRFGQKKTVFVYKFLVAGSFEEQLQHKAVFKMQLASRVVDKKNPVSWGKRLGAFLHPIKQTPAQDLSPFLHRDSILDKLIGYKGGGAIRQIVSTDTFEEEDMLNRLTAQENQDVEEMVKLERLRHTDREKYDRLMEKRQQEEQMRELCPLPRTVETPTNSRLLPSATYRSAVPHASQTMGGVSNRLSNEPRARNETGTVLPQTQNAGAVVVNKAQFASSQQPTAAPLPMAGANTYFAKSAESAPTVNAGPPVTPQGTPRGSQTTPSTKRSSLFSHPRSQTKDVFETKLASILEGTGGNPIPGLAEPGKRLAEIITSAIDKVRKEQSLGFLPDNQRWRLLLDHIQTHRRFVVATVSRFWTPDFLALATSDEIERRISILNSLSEEEFRAQMDRSARTPDPSNLHNLHRTNVQSAGAREEDLEVMRQAADKRRQRKFRLPPWANEMLRGEPS